MKIYIFQIEMSVLFGILMLYLELSCFFLQVLQEFRQYLCCIFASICIYEYIYIIHIFIVTDHIVDNE